VTELQMLLVNSATLVFSSVALIFNIKAARLNRKTAQTWREITETSLADDVTALHGGPAVGERPGAAVAPHRPAPGHLDDGSGW
jgi:hypothetical protein